MNFKVGTKTPVSPAVVTSRIRLSDKLTVILPLGLGSIGSQGEALGQWQIASRCSTVRQVVVEALVVAIRERQIAFHDREGRRRPLSVMVSIGGGQRVATFWRRPERADLDLAACWQLARFLHVAAGRTEN